MKPNITVGIDPGLRESGVAVFDRGSLVYARNFDNEDIFDQLRTEPGHVHLLVEMPQTYGGRAAGRSDANVLLALARVVGRFEEIASQGLGWQFSSPLPAQWKGQLPKDVMCRRAWRALSVDEQSHCGVSTKSRAVLGSKGDLPDSCTHILDATGIALWAQKRPGFWGGK